LNERFPRWTPTLLALLSALLVTLSHPFAIGSFVAFGDAPNGLLAWVALIPLWLAIRDAAPRRAFRLGWAFGTASFLGTIFWIYIAMNSYGRINAPISAVLTLGFCVFMGLFPAVTTWLARWLDVRHALPAATALPFAWATVEWIRNYILTGFPWSNIAYTQWRFLIVAQIADVVGLYGIVALIVAVNIALAELFLAWRRRSADTAGAAMRARITAALLALTLAYGVVRIRAVDAAMDGMPTLPVALVQGNITQDQKHATGFRDRVRAIYEGELVKAEATGAALVVWPEASFPHAIHVRSDVVPAKNLGHVNSVWLLGGAASWWDEGEVRMAQNSAILVAPGKKIAARYHKSHLVPFGEYVPMKKALFFVKKLTQAAGNFIPGRNEEIAPISLPLADGGRARLGILICYEDIFPEVSRLETARGAEVLVNMTNDAWYGRTSAPFQHVSMTVFRAIESRRSVIRSAQTGVSAFVDPSGRVRSRTPIFEGPLTLHVDVPRGGPDSLYVRFGDVFAAASAGLVLAASLRAVLAGSRVAAVSPART
jgi:apolipoprotein N-acyltransferase